MNVRDLYVRIRVADILVIALGLGFLSSMFFSDAVVPEPYAPVMAMVEHRTILLENWYGIQIQITKQPDDQVLVSGRFQGETSEMCWMD